MRSLFFLIVIVTFSSCQFNQSVHKDLTTGAYMRGDGLGVGDVIIEVNNNPQNRNTYTEGEKVEFVFNDVFGFEKIDGKAYPGLSMTILRNETDTILHEEDLMVELGETGTDLSPLQLRAFFGSGNMTDNDDYEVFINIWDKKGDGTYTYEMPFSVAKNNLFEVTAEDLTYERIFLWNELAELEVVSSEVPPSKYALVFEAIEGLTVIDGMVYPRVSILLEDNTGLALIQSDNIFEDIAETGFSYDVFKGEQIPVSLTFANNKVANPVTLKAVFKDGKSDRKLTIEGELIIK